MSKLIKVGNSKGVYIPGNVLKEANLNVGDEISFDVNEKGQVVMSKDNLGEERDSVEKATKKLADQDQDSKEYAHGIIRKIKSSITTDDNPEKRVNDLLKATKKGSVSDAIKSITDKPLKDYL